MIQRTNEQGAAMLRRLAKAARIVRADGLLQFDNAWVVRSDTGRLHAVNGRCDCADYEHNRQETGGWCKHRLAVYLVEKTQETGRPLEEWLRIATQSVINKHPAADGDRSDGVPHSCTDEGSATEAIWQARLKQLESEVYALRAALEEHLTRYEKHLEARRMFAPQ